ncbi:MAG: right-handed parallel beta-helix repeat-containing protein [bacterium]|nr:right-handed parallel beta-helix repeat-containing protein [bacterium]
MKTRRVSQEVRERVLERIRGALATAVAIGVCLAASSAFGATFSVNSTADTGDATPGDGACFTGLFIQIAPGVFAGQCTLRAAIEEGNALAGADVVEFAATLPTVAGVVEIFPTSLLPTISDPLTIDGYTAPGYALLDPNAKPIINIGGGQAGGGAGLVVTSGATGSVIRGLAIHGFDLSGIIVTTGTRVDADVAIEGCHIGISRGVFYPGNGAYGIEVRASRSVRIGKSCGAGACTGRRNVIASSGSHGIRLANSLFVDVNGNLIGTDTFGSSTFVPFGGSTPNGGYGVALVDGSTRNQIGSALEGGGNLISGNGLGGVLIEPAVANTVIGNTIGTNLAGTSALGNQGSGIEIVDGFGHLVRNNLISANDGAGIDSEGANRIDLNIVGLNRDLDDTLGNGSHGIQVDGVDATIEGNIVGGNAVNGILAFGADHTILRNTVGTNAQGDDLGNDWNGIIVSGAQGVVVGEPGLGNIVGHQRIGIGFSFSSAQNFVLGNCVGTLPSGTPIPNSIAGVYVSNSDDVEIGTIDGLDNGGGNVIGHNAAPGIQLVSGGSANTGSRVRGNWIGVLPDGTPAPNADGGVQVQGSGNTIGAALGALDEMVAAAANVFAHNEDSAIRVFESAQGTTVRGNVFFESFDYLPVDLGDDGETDNDLGDTDVGANQLQNLPLMDPVFTEFNPITGDLEVRYLVDADPLEASYPLKVDFYLRTTPDGRADVYVGSDLYPATAANTYRLIGVVPQIEGDLDGMLVATATDADGNTSELTRQSVPVPEPGAAGMLVAGCLALTGITRARDCRRV